MKGIILCICAAMVAGGGLFAQITPHEAVAQMKRGINMGNTLEPEYEGQWARKAEEYYFEMYAEAGFDVVRVPVRWNMHTASTTPFKIDETWMNRVEEVVDWGLSRGMFIVINAHHDNWIKNDYANPVYRARFDSIWSQIAVRFKDKSEKLIFEILNEPHGLTEVQNNELHARILSIIRRTNPTRNVIIQGNVWGGADELIAMAIPDDDYLIGSFHTYDPWPFGLEGTGTFGSPSQIQALDNKFARVKDWSNQNNIPVFLGEFGCNRSAPYNSLMKHYRTYVNLSLTYGFTFCAWDNGGTEFRILKRDLRSWDEVKDVLIYSSPGAPTIQELKVKQDTLVEIRWSRGTGDHDSIFVERRTMKGSYSRIAALEPVANSFVDSCTVPDSYHYYHITAHYIQETRTMSNPLRIHVKSHVPGIRGCFHGEPIPVPGTVEAEDFDKGGEGLAYHDMDSRNIAGAYRPGEGVDIYDRKGTGYHIGNALPGEWYEYTLDVRQGGDYLVDAHLACVEAGGKFQVTIGKVSSGTLETVNSYSWLDTEKVTFHMTLDTGLQIMRFSVIDQPLFNIDKLDFTLNSTGTGTAQEQAQKLVVFQDTEGDLLVKIRDNSPIEMLNIYDISGSLRRSVRQPDQPYRLTSGEFKKGIYLIRAYSGKKYFTRKTIFR